MVVDENARVWEHRRTGMPLVESVCFALWPPELLRGRRRAGPTSPLHHSHWPREALERRRRDAFPANNGFVSCYRCDEPNEVSLPLHRRGRHRYCDGCGAVLTRYGTWVPDAGVRPQAPLR